MSLFRRRVAAGPPAVPLAPGDRVLAAAPIVGGGWLVASRYAVTVTRAGAEDDGASLGSATDTSVTAKELPVLRPWSDVDSAAWDPATATVTVLWADGGRPSTFVLADDRTLVPETLRERVQASVVLSRQVVLPGGRSARVAVRRDLSTQELFVQVVPGHRVGRDDPALREAVAPVVADLRDQVGLPPGADW